MATGNVSKKTVIDPVCGMEVDPEHARLTASVNGYTYYFCAEGCRRAFEATPEKYLQAKPHKHFNWWHRYLQRLEKSTGGKPMSCCH